MRRNTIDQAKEILKFGSNRHEHGRETKATIDLCGRVRIIDENCTTKPLLCHPTAGQQPSNESTASSTKIEGSVITASSFV